MNNSKNDDKIGLVIGFIVIVLIAIALIVQYNIEEQIKKYEKKVIGKVVELSYGTRYSLKYEYIVNKKRYRGSTGVSKFFCEDGTKGCVGKKFYVYYSSKNPEYSRIYLGKYERYKTTLEFFK